MVARSMLCVALVVAAACGHNPPQSSDRKPSMHELTIVTGSARYALDIGYGRVYQTPVAKVVEGELADRTIGLRLFVNMDGSLYAGHFRDIDQPPLTLRFARAPSSSDIYEGFTAADGTTWKLVSVEP